MIPIRIPKWIESIRSVIATMVVGTFCYVILWRPDVIGEKLTAIKELTMLVVTFYYVLKRRNEGEQNGKEQPL